MPKSKINKIEERDHQTKAINNWYIQKSGIFKHATGSGKTITSILIMDKLLRGDVCKVFLIIVPGRLLLYQWEIEIEKFIDNSQIMLCGDHNDEWKSGGLKNFLRKSDKPRIAISILNTAISEKFINQLKKIKRLYGYS